MITQDIWITVTILIFLLLLSGSMSLSETALTGASKARISQLDKSDSPKVKRLLHLIDKREAVIPALLLGNNLVNIFASALATSLLLHLTGTAGVLYATIIMTVLVVLFGEIMPKGYALAKPDQALMRFSLFIRFISFIFFPLAYAADGIGRFTLAKFGIRLDDGEGALSAIDEIRGAVDLLDNNRDIKDERDMLGGLLDLNDMRVRDVMVHRTAISSVCAEDNSDETVSTILSSSYTRMPVWSDKPENIIGLVHGKDLLKRLVEVEGRVADIDIKSIMTKPWFVPSMTTLDEQLRQFRKRKTHFSFVIDEYGEFMGIVTLEDIIEEIVGDINDEHDHATYNIHVQPDGSVIVEGQMPIRDLNRRMDWDLPDDEANTIAGLIIHEAQRIPEQDQTFTFFGYRMVVMMRVKNRIARLKIRKLNAIEDETRI